MAEIVNKILSNPHLFQAVIDNAFTEVDDDKSGIIHFRELDKKCKEIAPLLGINVPTHEELSEIISSVDKNSDKKLDKSEFTELYRTMLQEMLEHLKKEEAQEQEG
eukprot:CAMPEP_0115034268 /NCGR_PEP_ID=MMETSP0216-20121206/40531_1 /TAXON_ID=223996 /ORGANISM="Protocruzia adherens, Strain Boccale" /LENGTH=105 /DNA_ID=CAMNT_0002413083 /DNA_START=37 /DNA_END=354 /DNA_ORIENTATION=+